jgi:hypothetical protein
MLVHHPFDFTWFDAEPLNFDLLIEATEKFESSIRPLSHQIISAIQPSIAEWIGNKLFCSMLRPIQIATRNADSTNTQFPRDTLQHRLKMAVENVRAYVSDRFAGRGHICDFGLGRPDRALARALEVEKTASVGGPPHRLEKDAPNP